MMMRIQAGIAFVLAASVAQAGASASASALRTAVVAGEGVHWKGRFHDASKLPDEMRPSARAAVAAWAEWANANEYRLDLEPEGRVLIGTPSGSSQLDRWLALETRTIELFETLLPAPERRDVEAEAADTPSEPEELPEDPDGAPAGFTPSHTWTYSFEWGSAPPEPDVETAVLLVLRGEGAQASLLTHLAERFDYLASWAQSARSFTGFVLEQPMLGAYLLDASGQEEWNPDNELVNRLTQLLVMRRFGRQPYWIVQGMAWVAEQRICGAIYCFPYRHEFVWATEHTSWEQDLARRFQDGEDTIPLEELCAWSRGKYLDGPAKLSWGMMRFLVQRHGEALPEFLEGLRVYCDEHGRIDRGGGDWERDLSFRVPVAELERFLELAFGERVLQDALEFIRAGSAPKPAKPEKRKKPR